MQHLTPYWEKHKNMRKPQENNSVILITLPSIINRMFKNVLTKFLLIIYLLYCFLSPTILKLLVKVTANLINK